jgi:hypothetical protein
MFGIETIAFLNRAYRWHTRQQVVLVLELVRFIHFTAHLA